MIIDKLDTFVLYSICRINKKESIFNKKRATEEKERKDFLKYQQPKKRIY